MVSIIIPIYNGEKYIRNAITSVLNQSYRNIEIIVINDGSTDELDSSDVLSIDTNIRFYSKENEGLGMTRNLGIALAKGDYIFFLDADDILPRNAIELLRTSIRNNDFIIGQCKRVYLNKSKKIYKQNIWKNNLYKKTQNKYNFIIDTIATNKLYKKDFLIQNNIQFLTGLYEDKLFVLKIFELCTKFTFIKEIVYYWQIHHDSTSITNSLTISNLKKRMKVNNLCLSYTEDKQLKSILIHNIIKHDFKVYINKSLHYSDKQRDELYVLYRSFYNQYKNDIHNNQYFVDRIIIENMDNKSLILKEFQLISLENSGKNLILKFKKYLRYSLYFLKVKFL
ncbi:MAG TPA: glycosyltransferase family 2 protein [Arcobacter sp.]|nr:glycosyltransferase family 2 protein [Arcobacter sp.]